MSDQDFIERFEAFARSKPAGERYEFGLASQCAFAQFEKAEGTYEGPRYCNPRRGGLLLPRELFGPLIASPNTFSALADRLAKLRGESA